MKILSVGHALMDYFVFGSDEYPAQLGLHLGSFNHLSHKRILTLLEKNGPQEPMAGGGSASVVRLGSQLGLKTSFAGKCGNDVLGRQFQREMSDSGVSCLLQETTLPTGICITYLSGGIRTIATARSAAGEIAAELVSDELLEGVDIVLLEGYLLYNREVLYRLLRRAQEKKIKTAFDPSNLILVEDFKEEILVLIENFVDYLFINEAEATALAGQDFEQAMEILAHRCTCVAVKRGDHGSLLLTQGKTYPIPSIGPLVTDPTGAGDGYTAGFLFALTRSDNPEHWGKAGAMVAAEVLRCPGSRMEPNRIPGLLRALEELVGPALPARE